MRSVMQAGNSMMAASLNNDVAVLSYTMAVSQANLVDERELLEQCVTNAFSLAIAKGNEAAVCHFLATSLDTIKSHRAAVQLAAEYGHLAILSRLSSSGFDLNIREGIALRLAIENDHAEAAFYLLDQGVLCNGSDGAALVTAVERGHVDLVEALLEHGADMYLDTGKALLSAVSANQLGIMARFKEGGGDLRFNDDCLLLRSVHHGHMAMTRYLIESCDINEKETLRRVLARAKTNDFPDLIDYLESRLQHNASLNML